MAHSDKEKKICNPTSFEFFKGHPNIFRTKGSHMALHLFDLLNIRFTMVSGADKPKWLRISLVSIFFILILHLFIYLLVSKPC